MSAPDHEMFPITIADGTTVELRADTIRESIKRGFVNDKCSVCGKHVTKQGQGPHMNAHKRLVGDAPPRPKRDTRKKKRANKVMDEAAEAARLRKTDPVKPNPVEMPPLFETLTGVLYGYAGDTIPTSMLAEVSEWMASTEHLINALTKETK